jgi:hypothetical protein
MDGHARHTLISENLHQPNGLTIDYPSNRLYWVDPRLYAKNMIETALLDGTGR